MLSFFRFTENYIINFIYDFIKKYCIIGLYIISSIIYVLKDETKGRIIYAVLLIIVIWFVSNTSVVVDTDALKNRLNEKKHKK